MQRSHACAFSGISGMCTDPVPLARSIATLTRCDVSAAVQIELDSCSQVPSTQAGPRLHRTAGGHQLLAVGVPSAFR